ncbi:MAG: hypothetical protein A2314_07130 [Elusimicrobia bacterium RIFOXYB2_FULL_50_12]|nr:MAG: hypothetical protein A2314_07130 [Elusimicrobia bacterium RIFOXYB2_FULL_50_12]
MKKILAILILISAACNAGEPAPKRIVSLAPSITRSIYQLEAGASLAGVTIYCPAQAKDKEKIGTLLEPNIEKIVALRPDLVIATKEGNRPETVRRLNELGIPVYTMESFDNFEAICNGFIALGKRIGRQEQANAIVEQSRRRVEQVRKKSKAHRRSRVFWQVGAQPLFTVSRHSFVNDFIELAGGINIFADLKSRYPQVSREAVLHADPDVIILVAMGDVTENEAQKWKNFKPGRTGKIVTLNNTVFTDPAPASFAEGLEIISRILHE